MKTWILTGVPGWFGTRMLEVLLRRGDILRHVPEGWHADEVRCLVLPGKTKELREAYGSAVTLIEGDVRDADTVRRLFAGTQDAFVCHAAGVIHPARVKDFFDVNVRGTVNILDAMCAQGARSGVFLSSNSPFGGNEDPSQPFTEASAYCPYGGYGRSKMLMEQAIHRYRMERGLRATILRPCWFFGTHQPARQTRFFQLIARGQFPLIGRGQSLRSLTNVDDLCQAVLRVSCLTPEHHTYWIALPEPVSIQMIVETVREALGAETGRMIPPSSTVLPAFVSSCARAVDRGLQAVGLYHTSMHVLGELGISIVCSSERARHEIGWQPETTLKEGMRRSVRWLLDHGVAL